MALYEIPTGPTQRVMTIALGGTVYTLRFSYADAPDAGWFMDVSDAVGNALVCGLPLVTGADLLQPYPDIGFVGHLFVVTADGSATSPSFDDLGVTAHVYYEDTTSSGAYLTAYLAGFAEAA